MTQVENVLVQTMGVAGIILLALWGIYKVLWPALEKRNELILNMYHAELERQKSAIAQQVEERRDLNEHFIGALETQVRESTQAYTAIAQSLNDLISASRTEHKEMLGVLAAIERRINGKEKVE